MSAFLKSTLITNRDAVPKVLTDAFLSGGIMEEVQGSVKTGASDTANSYYRLISIPSNARISELDWQSDALGSGCIVDVGVWYPTVVPQGGANFLAASLGGTIISSSIFAAGLTAPAANALTVITNQSLNYLIPLQETPLWNVLGLTADPEISFDIGFVTRVATAAAGYVGMKCRYQY
jgi:hypothetical protein